MKIIKRLKGFVIAQQGSEFHVFTKEEYVYGDGCRYPEVECTSMSEALEFINCYED